MFREETADVDHILSYLDFAVISTKSFHDMAEENDRFVSWDLL